MKAIDTNVLVRIVTGDDAAQAERAAALIAADGAFVPLTVLMEAEWVLRSFYRWHRSTIAAALRAFAMLEGVMLDRVARFDWLLDRYEGGADLADMIHLVATADEVAAFATFDGRVARHAGSDAPIAVETLAA